MPRFAKPPEQDYTPKIIGVLFGCFGRKIDGTGLPGGFIIYQGNPSIFPKRTPMPKMAIFGSPFLVSLQNHEKGGTPPSPAPAPTKKTRPISVPLEVALEKKSPWVDATPGQQAQDRRDASGPVLLPVPMTTSFPPRGS